MPGIDRHTELWISYNKNVLGDPVVPASDPKGDLQIAAERGGPIVHNFNSEVNTGFHEIGALLPTGGFSGYHYRYDFTTNSDALTMILSGQGPIIYRDYTIDFWVNFSLGSVNSWQDVDIIFQQIGPNGDFLKIFYDGSDNKFGMTVFANGNVVTKTLTGTVFSSAPSGWQHFAIDYEGSGAVIHHNFTFYVNGTNIGTITYLISEFFLDKNALGNITDSGFITFFQAIKLASSTPNREIGLDEMRISRIRRWPNIPGFVRPFLQYSLDPEVGVMTGKEHTFLNFDVYPFVDSIPNNPATIIETGPNVSQDTDEAFFGVGSMNLGGDSYITVIPHPDNEVEYFSHEFLGQETSDDLWFYMPDNILDGTYTLFTYFHNPSNFIEVNLVVSDNGTAFELIYNKFGSGVSKISSIEFNSGPTSLKKNAWNRVTLKQDKNIDNMVQDNAKIYLNGELVKLYFLNLGGSFLSVKLRIGANHSGNQIFTGKIDLFSAISIFIFNDLYPQAFYSPRFNQNTHTQFEFEDELVPDPSILSGKVPSNVPDFALTSNSLYIAGIEPMLRVNSEERILLVGSQSPPVAPTLSNISNGVLNGTYDYVITLIDSDGNESGPSRVSNQISVVDKNIRVTLPLAGFDATSAKQVNIYRRKTSIGETEHFLVDTINFPLRVLKNFPAPAYEDKKTDDEVSKIIIAPSQSVGPPPTANFIEWNDAISRMFYGFVKLVDADGIERIYSTRLYLSDVNAPHRVNRDNFIVVGSDDSDPITGLSTLQGALIVFKERSIHQVIGVDLTSISRIKVSPQVGCVSNLTIVKIDKALLFLSDEGVYAFDGINLILLSDAISPIFKNMPSTRKPYARAAYCPTEGLYILSLSRTDTTKNDTLLVYHYREFLETGKHKWTVWPIEEQILEETILGSNRTIQIYSVNSESRISKFQGSTDFGQTFTAELVGPSLAARIGRRQHLRYLKYIVDYNSAGLTNFSVGYRVNNSQSLTNITSDSQEELLVNVNRRQYFIAPVIKFDRPIFILSYNFDTKVIGFR